MRRYKNSIKALHRANDIADSLTAKLTAQEHQNIINANFDLWFATADEVEKLIAGEILDLLEQFGNGDCLTAQEFINLKKYIKQVYIEQ